MGLNLLSFPAQSATGWIWALTICRVTFIKGSYFCVNSFHVEVYTVSSVSEPETKPPCSWILFHRLFKFCRTLFQPFLAGVLIVMVHISKRYLACICIHTGRSSCPCKDQWEKLYISLCTSQKHLSIQSCADQPCAAIWTEVCWPSLLKTKEITRK